MKIDIRGNGGLIMMPPSYSPKHDKQYIFIEGNINAITSLPRVKTGSLDVSIPQVTVDAAIPLMRDPNYSPNKDIILPNFIKSTRNAHDALAYDFDFI